MKKLIWYIFCIAVIAISFIACLAIFVTWNVRHHKNLDRSLDTENVQLVNSEEETEEAPKIDIILIQGHLKDVGILISSKFNFEEMINYDDPKYIGKIELSILETKYIASYEGTVSAGVDFTQITVEKNDEERTVTVYVPEASIQSVEVDNDSLKVYEEKTGWNNPIDVEELNKCMDELKDNARESAIEKGILQEADENAAQMIEGIVSGLLEGSGYTYIVVTK